MPADAPTAGRVTVWRSVRFRITAAAVLALLVVLAATGLALVVLQRGVLTESLDESLAAQADVIEQQVRDGSLPAVLAPRGDDDTTAQVTGLDGEVVAASAGIAGERALAVAPTGEGDRFTSLSGIPGDDEVSYRLVSRLVSDGTSGEVVILVASPLDDIEESIDVLVRSLLIIIPVVGLVLAGLVWILVGGTLRPVEAIRSEVAGIGGQELDRRVPEPATGDEIARLARTMNAMLDRVEQSHARQRELVADASHELRTPLTRMRAELEVDLAHPETADFRATHRSLLEETEGMQRLVDDLLLLARSSEGAPPSPGTVALDDVVRVEARRLSVTGPETVDYERLAPLQVPGDADQLQRAVRNLLANAGRHARQTVAIELAEVDGRAVVTVDDDGPGIPVADRARIFERFTRLDEARSAGAGGTGLGLAITRAIAERHGGTVSVYESPLGGARFRLTVPITPHEQPVVA